MLCTATAIAWAVSAVIPFSSTVVPQKPVTSPRVFVAGSYAGSIVIDVLSPGTGNPQVQRNFSWLQVRQRAGSAKCESVVDADWDRKRGDHPVLVRDDCDAHYAAGVHSRRHPPSQAKDGRLLSGLRLRSPRHAGEMPGMRNGEGGGAFADGGMNPSLLDWLRGFGARELSLHHADPVIRK